jgi:uncharacterized protein YndB with AHSA1/START domain
MSTIGGRRSCRKWSPSGGSRLWQPYAIDQSQDYSDEESTLVEFTLERSASGTLLRVVESGFDKIPSKRRAEAFRMNDQGWGQQVKNIAQHVEQAPTAA